MEQDGQGWHYDNYDHALAAKGIKTRAGGISEPEAQQIVQQIKMGGKPPSQVAQEKAQMTWYDELWIKGESIPETKLNEMDLDDLQRVRKVAVDRSEKSTDKMKEFYKTEATNIGKKVKEKLEAKIKDMEKQSSELGGGGGLFG